MVDFRKSVLHAHKEEVEEDVVDDDDEDDLDNENSLRSIEAKLDRALSDVSHLTVDNLSNSLSQSLGMEKIVKSYILNPNNFRHVLEI